MPLVVGFEPSSLITLSEALHIQMSCPAVSPQKLGGLVCSVWLKLDVHHELEPSLIRAAV
jgi:hypothetical protein